MAWYTYIAVGGGIFALRRPRPYSRAFARMPLRHITLQMPPHCGLLHAHTMPHMESCGFNNEAGHLRGHAAWLGRALAPLGTAPTKNEIANLDN